jgi:hypothetical protein
LSHDNDTGGGWVGSVLDTMRMDPTFWPDCDEHLCPKPATMLHKVHAGTVESTGEHVTAAFVYCDEHSRVHMFDRRILSAGPLQRPAYVEGEEA